MKINTNPLDTMALMMHHGIKSLKTEIKTNRITIYIMTAHFSQ